MDYDLKSFGKKLVEIREKNQLTQKDVKDKVGVNEDTLRKVENGLVLPRIDTIDRLSIIYKQDIYLLFSSYRLTFDNYFSKRIRYIANHFKNYDYDQLKKEAEVFKEQFKDSKYYKDELVMKKGDQFYEYLMSLYNFNNAFKDDSRKDLSRLFDVLDYNINDFYNDSKNIYLDKLEILILLLISIIYRYRDEFENAKVILDRIEYVLSDSHKNDPEYMYYYVLVIYNKMTLFNRIDDFDAIDGMYYETLTVFDEKLNLQNVLTLMMRVGINKGKLKHSEYKELVITSLNLLRDSGKSELAEKYKHQIIKQYPDLNIF
ncbi:MAG: helix-turn-helix transcriptional regulator [Clostridia bacterium]|nr:helix-turn-helix transcriptional regulator [Clostridia bacterium]